MRLRFSQRGDTIIEVMLAFTVFAMLAVGTITIMNRGVSSAQDALETTLVRQQIDGQAETLRFMYQSYVSNPSSPTRDSVKNFKLIEARAFDGAASKYAEKDLAGKDKCLAGIPGNNSFLLNPKSGAIISSAAQMQPIDSPTAPAYAQIKYNDDGTVNSGYGLWIEAVRGGEGDQPKFIDFHIRACWNSVASEAARTLGTIIRLYLPTNETGQLVGVGTGIPQLKSYTLQGIKYDKCETFGPQELEDTNTQRHALFDNSPTHEDSASLSNSCRDIPSMGVFRSCVNYDAEYSPKIEQVYKGRYKLTVSYLDSNCSTATPQPPFFETIPATYNYRVALYVDTDGDGNSEEIQQGVLPPSTSQSPTTFTYTSSFLMNENSKIQLRWWNNRFIQPGNLDPDFTISQLKLERISSE